MKFDLNTLSGKHKLTGVGHATSEEGYVLEIDGKLYIVYDCSEDEYRSRCAIKEIVEGDYYSEHESVTRFPEQEVEIKIGDFYHSDYLDEVEFESFEIHNPVDGSMIFNAWTEEWGDWYPCAQFDYDPENLPINKEKGGQ